MQVNCSPPNSNFQLPSLGMSYKVNQASSSGSVEPPVKTESGTPSTHSSFAASVSQSIDSYMHAMAERKHKANLANILLNCPLLKNIPNTYKPTSLRTLSDDSLGVPLYVHLSSRDPTGLQVGVPPDAKLAIFDDQVENYRVFGTKEAKREMVLSIFKFLEWQCGIIQDLDSVSDSRRNFGSWTSFPQTLLDRCFRMINIPATVLYPNGQASTHPIHYTDQVMDDLIKQFAHKDATRRFGVVSTAHDTQPFPLMAKVCLNCSSRPIEWSCIGSINAHPSSKNDHRAPMSGPSSPSCRCNLCVDALLGGAENRLGLQLVIEPNEGLSRSPAASKELIWKVRWDQRSQVFDVGSHNLILDRSFPPAEASSQDSSSAIVLPKQNVKSESKAEYNPCVREPTGESSPSYLAREPQLEESLPFIFQNLAEESDENDVDYMLGHDIDMDSSTSSSESDRDAGTLDQESASDRSMDDSDQSMEDSSTPYEVLDYSIPKISAQEVLWDLEDFDRCRLREMADQELKQQRDAEDYTIEVERRKHRITMETEWLTEQIAEAREREERRIQQEREEEQRRIVREREEADRRRQLQRKEEDEKVKARLQKRLASAR